MPCFKKTTDLGASSQTSLTRISRRQHLYFEKATEITDPMVANTARWRTAAKLEHYDVVYFCAHTCGEAVPESFGPEDRSNTNGRQPSTSWRMRKVGGFIQSESEDPRTRSSISEGGRRWMSSSSKENSPSFAFFVLFGHSIGWYPPALMQTIFFLQSIDSNANLF